MNENYDDCHHRKITRTFIYTKIKNNCETFSYTKSQTLFKKLDNSRYVFIYKKLYTWRYGIFMKFLKLAIICKNMTLCVTWRFNIQKLDTSQKTRQFAIRFYIQKPGTFALHNFYPIFKSAEGEGTFIYFKNNAFCVTFLYWKTMHFALRWYIQRAWHYQYKTYCSHEALSQPPCFLAT